MIKSLTNYWLLLIGILLNFCAGLFYFTSGYTTTIFYLWLFSLLSVGLFFFKRRSKNAHTQFGWLDVYAVAGLLIIFVPVYLGLIYYIPHQINTDEPTIMFFSRNFSQENSDVFGLTNYFNYPSLIFAIFGKLSSFLGGIDLLHYRTVHASSGITIIIFSYLFFRLAAQELFENCSLIAYVYPLSGAIVLGSNHSLIAISRMAMRDNSALLTEISALTLLFLGLRRRCLFYTYLGSIFVGLSFYVYLPARITIIIWLLFVTLTFLFFRNAYNLKELLRSSTLVILGALLVALPLFIATSKANGTELVDIRHKLLIFEEARRGQKEWVGASSIQEGLKINIDQGLTAFNKRIHDHNYVYLNYGHGFVDPLTGILIWAGFLSVTINMALIGRRKEIYLLVLVGFLSIWLILSFLFNKNPHYNRLLSILPFISFLVIEGLRNLSMVIDKISFHYFGKDFRIGTITYALMIVVITMVNLSAFGDYVENGFREGDILGGTARYQGLRKDMANYKFYLAASPEYPYYSWGEPWMWEGWLKPFASGNQISEVIRPEDLPSSLGDPPLTVFMSNDAWRRWESDLRGRFLNLRVSTIKPDGSRVAIEIK